MTFFPPTNYDPIELAKVTSTLLPFYQLIHDRMFRIKVPIRGENHYKTVVKQHKLIKMYEENVYIRAINDRKDLVSYDNSVVLL